jgi:hypothetical protein
MKITFSYLDGRGTPVNDEQVITLLVYDLPKVEVSFYQQPGEIIAGQANLLPLQVVSLGKRTAVLGRITVTSNNGFIDNGESLVGNLDPGGYYTLDAMLTPISSGPAELTVTIEYKDDFNQSRTISQQLSVNVSDMPVEPSPGEATPSKGESVPGTTETFWHKIWRFILGLFGLDSSNPTNSPALDEPTTIPIQPVVPGGKGG